MAFVHRCPGTAASAGVLLAAVLLGGSLSPASGGAFLSVDQQEVTLEVERTLLQEIEEALGSEHRAATEGRLEALEDALRHTFASLPKNEHGNLGHVAARYALHRLFVRRHGWFIEGLRSNGDGWGDASSPADMLQDRVPEHVQSLFEQRLGGRGLDLREVAVLAAMHEQLVHKESLGKARAAYGLLGLSEAGVLNASQAAGLIDTFMASYVLGRDLASLSARRARELPRVVQRAYPHWQETRRFAQGVLREVAPAGRGGLLGFEDVSRAVEEIGERYGRWQDGECRTMKADLVALGDGGSGRVPLSEFYRPAVEMGRLQFSESPAYLRRLGALDETDPGMPGVLVANYITSPSNCVASSRFYSVCCLDECEELVGHLEEALGAAQAPPQRILELVARLPSASVPANRSLPAALARRLGAIAEAHGAGMVPLHGRLFAQWMHHAYPRECPYPHLAGTTRQQSGEDYTDETGEDHAATPEEMRSFVYARVSRVAAEVGQRPPEGCGDGDVAACPAWSHEEELFVPQLVAPRDARLGASLRHAAQAAALAAAAAALARVARSALGGLVQDDGLKKHIV